jgi:peroxiredoxin
LQPFVADYPGIRELGARVVAVSADSIARLASFEASLGIPFALASDSDLSVARRYGVDDQREGKSRRAAFVVAGDRRLIHANPDYVPANPSEYEAAVLSLGE